VPDKPREAQLPSQRVEADLRDRIGRNEWAPGERMPPVAELAAHYEVARSTVVNALRRIEADGLIEIVPNWGTFRAGA
jgi:DNA-binding GntR family transcriptional regulator